LSPSWVTLQEKKAANKFAAFFSWAVFGPGGKAKNTFAPAMELALNAQKHTFGRVGKQSGWRKQFSFPIKTCLVNITGCFALGLFYGMADRGQHTDNQVILFLMKGLCGGFTTFSAFSHDNILLLKNRNFMLAMLYVLLSVLLSFIAMYLRNRVIGSPVNS